MVTEAVVEQGGAGACARRGGGRRGEVFGGAVITSAILDRLLHRTSTVSSKVDSYLLRDKWKAGLVCATLTTPSPL